MTLHEYPDVEQGTEPWHDLRRGIVTASTVGKLLTPTLKTADNDTSRGVTATLVAERITGWTEDTYVSADMWHGTVCEPLARDAYSKEHAVAREYGFLVRNDWSFDLGYSPDGLVGDDGLIEIKCPRAKTHIGYVLADEVPSYYMAQLQTGLLVSGREWIDFVSFVGGLPLFVKRVFPDPKWFAAIEEAVTTFEHNAAEMVAAYETATAGLAQTERVLELEMSL